MPIDCPCCNNLSYADCCQPFHLDKEKPSTPEKLMRSRYSAYALNIIAYLLATTHPSRRYPHDHKEIENWAKSNVWLKLEICEAKKDMVEFKAYYRNGLKKFIHHEKSVFKKENGIWYYLNGSFPNQ